MKINSSDIAVGGTAEATNCWDNYTTNDPWCAYYGGSPNYVCLLYDLSITSTTSTNGSEYRIQYCATNSSYIGVTPNVSCTAGTVNTVLKTSTGVETVDPW